MYLRYTEFIEGVWLIRIPRKTSSSGEEIKSQRRAVMPSESADQLVPSNASKLRQPYTPVLNVTALGKGLTNVEAVIRSV